MDKKAVIVLAQGFEEIEAVTPIDILRRAGVNVVVAGLRSKSVKGAHDITINTDVVFGEIDYIPDVLVLPGGTPGAERLAASIELRNLINNMFEDGKLVAAICASPALVLAPSGILEGKKATCYPGMEENFSSSVRVSGDKVVQDGNVITSRGPATALEFSLKIVENIIGKETADLIGEKTLLYS